MLASGAGAPEPLVQSGAVFKYPAAWSPDGKYFVYAQLDEATQYDLWLMPLQGDRTPVPYLRTPFIEDTAAISPDGRWLAYASEETGRREVYVRSFPEPGEKYRVSTSGGTYVQWSNNVHELLFASLSQYFSGVGPVYVADVETTPTFKAGTPRLLFTPRANAKAAVVTIADMNSLEVEADVSESNLGKIRPGQPCEIQLDALPERRFRGEIHTIVPTADRSKADRHGQSPFHR